MKRRNWLISWMVSLTLVAVLLSGCSTAEQGAVGGSLLGAGIGAIIGGALNNPGLGAAIGAAAGGLGGAIVGAENQRRFCEMHKAEWDKLDVAWKNAPGELKEVQGRLCYVTNEGDYIVWRPNEQCWRTDD